VRAVTANAAAAAGAVTAWNGRNAVLQSAAKAPAGACAWAEVMAAPTADAATAVADATAGTTA
jgi:hypothetical protein